MDKIRVVVCSFSLEDFAVMQLSRMSFHWSSNILELVLSPRKLPVF